MRLLVVTPSLPHPRAAHGGGVYVGTMLESLAEMAEVHLVSFRARAQQDEAAELAEGLASVRAVPLRQGPARYPHHQIHMLWHWAGGRPLVAAKHWSPVMARALRRAVAEGPDAVLVEFAVMAQYLPYLADAPVVLTDHESGGPIPAGIGPGHWGRRREARLWRRYLHHYYPRAQIIQALTEQDAQELENSLERPVLVRPPAVPVPDRAADPASSPPRVVFFGDYRHHPNPEAAVTLAKRILPLLREQVPETELWLAGPNAPAAVQQLGNLAGVTVLGFVEDLAAMLSSARLLLAPLFSGAGTRIKILTALAHGLPVVSNSLGLRGIGAPAPAVHRREGVLELVAAALELLRSPRLAGEAGAAARKWAEANLSAVAVARLQLERVASLASGAD